MTHVKCSDIREKRPDEIEKELTHLNEELHRIKVTKKNDENIRKSIAHVHIVQNQNIKDNLRKFYQEEKYQPKDLRPKQTRAMRRLLTLKEEASQSAKTHRKQCAFPKRTFAIKE